MRSSNWFNGYELLQHHHQYRHHSQSSWRQWFFVNQSGRWISITVTQSGASPQSWLRYVLIILKLAKIFLIACETDFETQWNKTIHHLLLKSIFDGMGHQIAVLYPSNEFWYFYRCSVEEITGFWNKQNFAAALNRLNASDLHRMNWCDLVAAYVFLSVALVAIGFGDMKLFTSSTLVDLVLNRKIGKFSNSKSNEARDRGKNKSVW